MAKPDFSKFSESVTIVSKKDFDKFYDIVDSMNEVYFPKNKPLLDLNEIEEVTVTFEPCGTLQFTMPYKKKQ